MQNKDLSLLQNRLLHQLSDSQYAEFVGRCRSEKLVCGQNLHIADQNIGRVYFPLAGFVGVFTLTKQESPTDVILIGCEGMIGASISLGVQRAPFTITVQGAGEALSMQSTTFISQMKQSKRLRRLVRRYLYVQLRQLTQSAACFCHHDVKARLARWLLMSHDRSATGYVELTHATLAMMLGVRRSAISLAAGQLQVLNVIRYRRGRIEVISRAGLELQSCACYKEALDCYNDHLPESRH